MQREIKFRAWGMKNYADEYSKDNKMYYFDEIKINSEYNLLGFHCKGCKNYSDLDIDQEKMILMQYTGLLDKNGKEIYEGDILNNGNGPVYVFWNENYQAFWVGYDSEESEKQYYASTSDFCTEADEIIGNIYENPELLK